MKISEFLYSTGFKFFLVFLFFSYIIQIFIFNFIKVDLMKIYNVPDSSVYYSLLFLIIFVVFLILVNNIIPSIRKLNLPNNIFKILIFFGTITSLIFLFLSIKFYLNYSIGFRQHYRLRDVDILIKLLFIILPLIKIYVFFIFVYLIKNKFLTKILKINLFIILIGSLFSLNSSSTVIFLAIILSMLFKPNIYLKKITNIQLFYYAILLLFIALGVVFIGFANKGGINFALDFFTSLENFKLLILKVFVRVSTSFMSLYMLIDTHVYDLSLQMNTFSGTLQTFLQKVLIILPLDQSINNDILSVNRTNYELLYKYPNDTAGASPGLLASVFYIPFFPISILLIVLYALMVIRSINRYFEKNTSNIFVVLAIVFFVQIMYESPLKFLIILEPSFIVFMFFYLGSYINFSKNQLGSK